MPHFAEHHRSHLHSILHSNLSKIYFFRCLKSFAFSMVGIFAPLFLYNNGVSIVNILWYSIFIYLTVILFDPQTIKIINKIGFKYTLAISLIPSFFNVYLIGLVPDNFNYLWLAGIFQGIHLSMFFVALDAEIAMNGDNNHRGDQIGNLNMLISITSTVAPLLVGFILSNYDYIVLFFVSTFIASLGLIPLFMSENLKLKKFEFRYKDYWTMAKKGNLKNNVSYFFEGSEIILSLYIWPIALFILLKNDYYLIGKILSFASFLSLVLIFFLKKKIDFKKNKKKTLNLTTKFVSFEYFMKFFVYFFLTFFVYFIEFFSKIVRSFLHLSYHSIFLNNAKGANYLSYIAYRDFIGRLGRIVLALIFILILSVFGEALNIVFILLLFGVIISYFINFLVEENKII